MLVSWEKGILQTAISALQQVSFSCKCPCWLHITKHFYVDALALSSHILLKKNNSFGHPFFNFGGMVRQRHTILHSTVLLVLVHHTLVFNFTKSGQVDRWLLWGNCFFSPWRHCIRGHSPSGFSFSCKYNVRRNLQAPGETPAAWWLAFTSLYQAKCLTWDERSPLHLNLSHLDLFF